MRELVFNLHMILSDTVKMKEFQEVQFLVPVVHVFDDSFSSCCEGVLFSKRESRRRSVTIFFFFRSQTFTVHDLITSLHECFSSAQPLAKNFSHCHSICKPSVKTLPSFLYIEVKVSLCI